MAPRIVRYFDDEFVEREGEAVERNGSLTWIEDATTGEGDWVSNFQIIEE